MGRTKRRRGRKKKNLDKTCQSLHINQDAVFIDLVQWLKCHDWKPSVKLRCCIFSDTGRGLQARQHIESGDVIVKIPTQVLITLEVVSTSELADIFKDTNTLFSCQQVLSLYLVYQKHLGTLSKYFYFIQTIPSEFTVPDYCTSAEITLMPQFLKLEISKQKEKLENAYIEVIKRLSYLRKENKLLPCQHCQKDFLDLLNFDMFLWAWYAINTRAVHFEQFQPNKISKEDCKTDLIKVSDSNNLALAPYLDLFNHTSITEVEVKLNYLSSSNGFYELKTLTPYKKHDQVFIKYGPHSNLGLYLNYGFIDKNNPHDCVTFSYEEVLKCVELFDGQTLNIPKTKYEFMKKNSLLKNLFKTKTEFSWNLNGLIFILTTKDSDFSQWHYKVFCNIFSSSESEIIKSIGGNIVQYKLNELQDTHELMNLVNEPTDSFKVGKELIKEYINILTSKF